MQRLRAPLTYANVGVSVALVLGSVNLVNINSANQSFSFAIP